jgi:uncharacterized protein Yka (UPF0111/DUF47 family)
MSTTNIDQLLLGSKYKKTKNPLIEVRQSEEVGWWINELDSLGTKIRNNNESDDIQELEDHADEIKQAFIHDYKNCYNES